jgi:hypothetical protein
LENKEKCRKSIKRYQRAHPDQRRIIALRQRKTRSKIFSLHPIFLNKWFINSELHHLDRLNVAYIPKEMHQKYRHSLTKNRNMSKINDKVFEWMHQNSIEKFIPKTTLEQFTYEPTRYIIVGAYTITVYN